jgi:NAD dependent epimerase/dehydratase family enzyme
MTYLITGATGFIGTKLVYRLIERGDAVFYLARKPCKRLPSQASYHPWDATQEPELNALPRIDAIVYLAGESVAQRWTPQAKKRIYDSRVQGMRN